MVSLIWDDKYDRSFQKLKEKLTMTPTLIIRYPSLGFELFYDTSKKGMGSVLMHNGHVVAYVSR